MRVRRSPRNGESAPLSKTIEVLGRRLHYLEMGDRRDRQVLLVQLGIADSRLWTRVMPQLADLARVIALDLPGMGASEVCLPGSAADYTIRQQRARLGAFAELTDLTSEVVLVAHGLGSMVALDWAVDNASSLAGIAHIEAILRPLVWMDLQPPFRDVVRRARSASGEHYVVWSDHYLLEASSTETLYPLESEFSDLYTSSTFARFPAARYANLAALMQLPIGGRPVESHRIVERYANWLSEWHGPKLCILGSPGHVSAGRLRNTASSVPNQELHEVIGRHLLPVESPGGVGRFLHDWIGRMEERD